MDKKTISVIIIVILALNIILFALGKNSVLMFWLIIGICALIAYKVLPKFKN